MSKRDAADAGIKVVATNRRASMLYEIIETLEAGLALTGSEVKSLRNGKATLQDAFARVEGNQLLLMNMHISPYAMGSTYVTQEPTRTRKLLVTKAELKRLMGKTILRGMTIVALEVYFNKRGWAKVKLALAKGKNAPDRRDDIKKKTVNREMQREFGSRHRVR